VHRRKGKRRRHNITLLDCRFFNRKESRILSLPHLDMGDRIKMSSVNMGRWEMGGKETFSTESINASKTEEAIHIYE